MKEFEAYNLERIICLGNNLYFKGFLVGCFESKIHLKSMIEELINLKTIKLKEVK